MTIRIEANADPETLLATRQQIHCVQRAVRRLGGIQQHQALMYFCGLGPDDRSYSVSELAEAYQVDREFMAWHLERAIQEVRDFVRRHEV